MPIYEYRCSACGKSKDILQRLSDPPATECPSCGQQTLVKQVTAAGFQLKGTGWYATDFKNNGSKPAEKDSKSTDSAPASTETDSKAAAPASAAGSAPPASTPSA